ncbi:MAG: response regulator [Pseudomonadales bacterium]|nr:response regulator [Pseudomonadales bacterium]
MSNAHGTEQPTQPPDFLEIAPTDNKIVIGPHLSFIVDKNRNLLAEKVLKIPNNQWENHNKAIFNQGYNDNVYWLSVNLRLSKEFLETQKYFLEFDLPFFGMIDTYLISNNTIIQTTKTGLKRPLSQRAYPHESFVFPLDLSPDANYRILMRIESVSAILAPLTLYKEFSFHESHVSKNTLIGFYFGLSLILALYNFFLYLSTRDVNYFLYTIHVIGLCWMQVSLRGFSASHIWGDEFRTFAYYEPTMIIWITIATSLIFTRNFLKIQNTHKLFNYLLLSCFFISLVFMVGTFLFPIEVVLGFFNIFSPLVILLIISVAIYALRKGNRAARFFLLGWSFFLSSALAKTIYHIGWLPTNFFTTNPVIIGSALEGVLLSLALADRINLIQKEKDIAQKQAVDALAYSNKIKDDFLISISHELRTPLAGIIGATSLSRDSHNLTDIQSNNLLIEKSANRMSDTIDSILCLSELNSGELRLHRSDFNLKENIQDLIQLIQSRCEEKQLAFNVDLKAPINTVYSGDIAKIRLIIRHLLENAVSFTSKGHVSLLIEEANLPDSHLSDNQLLEKSIALNIHIYDTGDGIPDDKLNLIFEAFQQLSGGYARTHEGLGIGLTICKRLIDIMGGTLQVESKLGMGTHVQVSIPLAHTMEASTPVEPPSHKHDLHILVVEDNLVNQKVLTAMLKKLNCSISVANNGQECLTCVAQEKPDLIFMDCQMPIMDGIEATKQLRETYSDEALPIIAVTANALSNDRERCYAAGMNDYLTKPVKLETLSSTLHKWTTAKIKH